MVTCMQVVNSSLRAGELLDHGQVMNRSTPWRTQDDKQVEVVVIWRWLANSRLRTSPGREQVAVVRMLSWTIQSGK